MDLVVDANIIFAILIKESTTYHLFFSNHLKLYAPEFILVEIKKHKEEILNKTYRTTENLYKFFDILKRRVTFISLDELTSFLEKAKQISPDPKDEAYIASALKLNCSIWSNDKKLKEQKIIKVYSTKEIINL